MFFSLLDRHLSSLLLSMIACALLLACSENSPAEDDVAEGRRLRQTAERDLDRVIPQYPAWTLRDLVVHTASIHGRTPGRVTTS